MVKFILLLAGAIAGVFLSGSVFLRALADGLQWLLLLPVTLGVFAVCISKLEKEK